MTGHRWRESDREKRRVPLAAGLRLRWPALVALLLLALTGCATLRQRVGALLPQSTAQEMESLLQAHLATGNFMGAVLVARGDEVLHRGGYGMANLEHEVPNTPETVFRLASLTKGFTAAAIMQLQDQGLLNVHDPVSKYLPDFPHGNEITIHQLLNHTSGLPDYAQLPDAEVRIRQPVSLDDLLASFADLPLEFVPGSHYNYSNSGYALLTRIVEEVSGRPYAAYLDDHIFRPLGMANTGYEETGTILPHQAAGYVRAGDGYRHAGFVDMSNLSGAGALYSTVSDLHKWDRALAAGTVFSDQAAAAYFAPSAEIGDGTAYAYGWGVGELAGRTYIFNHGNMSGFDTLALRYPEQELFVAVFSNLESAPTLAIALGLAAIALGDPYEVPGQHTAVAVDPAIFERYAGHYLAGAGLAFVVYAEDGHLFVQPDGQQDIEIFPESETDFFIKEADVQLRFQVGVDGTATSVIVVQGGQELTAEKVE